MYIHSLARVVCLAMFGFLASACETHESSPPPVTGGGGTEGGSGGSGPKCEALAIGLNSVDPNHYNGWSGALGGCEPDAKDMNEIAKAANLDSTMLLTKAATQKAVLDAIAAAAGRIPAQGLFVLSYSGHGGQVPDENGDEPDGVDETWCLYDGQLIDDELYAALGQFKPDVRVLVFSDSCHSGTVLKMVPKDFTEDSEPRKKELEDGWKSKVMSLKNMPRERGVAAAASEAIVRSAPPDVLVKTFRKNRAGYEARGKAVRKDAKSAIQCRAILISGCGDPQTSADLGTNGLFTVVLKQVWNHGAFAGDHTKFHQQIRDGVVAQNPSQAPELFTLGPNLTTFVAQKPYTRSSL